MVKMCGSYGCGLNLNLLAYVITDGADQYRHSSSKRVKVKFCRRLPSFDEIPFKCPLVLWLSSYMSSRRKRSRRKTTYVWLCQKMCTIW